MKVMEQGAVKIRRVERGVAEENIGMEVRMKGEVIRKDRDKGGNIADRFILVRGIGLLLDIQFGMGGLERIIVKKRDVADDAQAVGKDDKLVGVTEMAIDIHLFSIRTGSGL